MCQRSVSNILNLKQKTHRKSANYEVSPYKQRPRRVRTLENITFVDNETNKEDPMSQKSMAKTLKCCGRSIQDIIDKDLNKQMVKKSKVHSINAKQMQQRKTVSRRLYERYLAGNRYKYIVTLDESYIYMSNTGGKRNIYYKKRDSIDDKSWVKVRERHPNGFMIVGAVSYNGKFRLIKVPKNIKINSNYYEIRLKTDLSTNY